MRDVHAFSLVLQVQNFSLTVSSVETQRPPAILRRMILDMTHMELNYVSTFPLIND